MVLTFSVVISCFNSEAFLEKTINSVVCQDYPISEIIVVDDGSTDGTLDILRSYRSVLTVLSHDNSENKGQAESLNLGIRHSSSHLIAFLDHDDLWYEGKIRFQVEQFTRDESVGLCYANGFVINEHDEKLYPIVSNNFKELNRPESLLLNCHIRTPSMVMVRRSLFDSVGFFSSQIFPPDHDMWIRLAEKTKFSYVDLKLVGYRQHSTQLSVTKNKKMWEDQFKVLENAVRRYPYSCSVQRNRKAVLYYRLGSFDYKHKFYVEAVKNFLLAFKNDPVRSVTYVFEVVKSKF